MRSANYAKQYIQNRIEQMSNSGKHALFFSNYCEFSKEVIRDLTKKNIRSLFVLICIDENRKNIPSCVDRVPLVITSSQAVFIEDDIPKFITMLNQITNNNNNNQNSSNSQQFIGHGNGDQRNMVNGNSPPPQTQNDETGIIGYSEIEMNNKYSNNFSYLGDEEDKNVAHTFATVDHDFKIHYVEENNSNGNNGNATSDPNMLDKIKAQRDRDNHLDMKRRFN